ncbi:hypothetical protein JE959_000185 [Aeromonas veronii]|nr:hypothetical protein [Aeromonas veronii]
MALIVHQLSLLAIAEEPVANFMTNPVDDNPTPKQPINTLHDPSVDERCHYRANPYWHLGVILPECFFGIGKMFVVRIPAINHHWLDKFNLTGVECQ